MFLFIGKLFTTEHAPNTHHFINTVSAPHNLRAFHGAVSRDIKLLKAHLPLGIFVKCFEDRMVIIFFVHSFFICSSFSLKGVLQLGYIIENSFGFFLFFHSFGSFFEKTSQAYLEPCRTSTMYLSFVTKN